MRTPKNEYDLDCYPHFCLSLFGDNRGLRFMCADFGWRTFYFKGKNYEETKNCLCLNYNRSLRNGFLLICDNLKRRNNGG